MEKKYKERVLIYSVQEIRPSLRIKAQKTAHLIGFFVSLLVVSAFLAFDFFPKQHDLFFQYMDWILKIGIPLAAYLVGYLFCLNFVLWGMGFVLAQGYPAGDGSTQSMNYSNTDSSAYRGYGFGSSMSINPGSGLPMSGSSGVDTRGNPYGTRSW